MFLKWTKWILKSTRIRSRYAYNSQLTSVYYFECSLDKILIYIFLLLTVFLGSFSSFISIVVMCLVAVSSSCDTAAKIMFVCIIILSICYVCLSVNIHLSPRDIPICHIYLSVSSYIYLSVQLLFSGPNYTIRYFFLYKKNYF